MRYRNRLYKLQNMLVKFGCESLLIDDPTNLFYFTGLNLSAGKLLVHHYGTYLLVDNRYLEMAQKNAPCPVLASNKNSLIDLFSHPELSYVRHLGFDSEKTSYQSYLTLLDEMKDRITLLPLAAPINTIRCIKDREEIQLLREANQLGSEGFDFVCSLLKEGITEMELAIKLEIFWKQRGSRGLAFDPIIAFGANSSMPHYRAGNKTLTKGDSVLIDIGVNLHHYNSDMTRVVFFGEPHPKIKKIYSIVKEAQRLALEICCPGTLISNLDCAARDYITSQGYGDYFTHSLGHGVGLDIHEYPILRNKPPYDQIPLEIGMVITIEPGIYLPNIGGVRLEDSILITSKGYENLTNRPEPVFTL